MVSIFSLTGTYVSFFVYKPLQAGTELPPWYMGSQELAATPHHHPASAPAYSVDYNSQGIPRPERCLRGWESATQLGHGCPEETVEKR